MVRDNEDDEDGHFIDVVVGAIETAVAEEGVAPISFNATLLVLLLLLLESGSERE